MNKFIENLLKRLFRINKRSPSLKELKKEQKRLTREIRLAELKEKRLLRQKERLDKLKRKTSSQNLVPAIEAHRSLIRTLKTAKQKIDRTIEQMELVNALQKITKLEKNASQLIAKMNKTQKELKENKRKIKKLSEFNKNQQEKSVKKDRKRTLQRTKKSRNLRLS